MRLQIWRKMLNRQRVGLIVFYPCLVAGLNRQANTFFNFPWDDFE
jgi:hypothetical protein